MKEQYCKKQYYEDLRLASKQEGHRLLRLIATTNTKNLVLPYAESPEVCEALSIILRLATQRPVQLREIERYENGLFALAAQYPVELLLNEEFNV